MAIPEPRPQPEPAPSPDGVLVVSPGSEIAPEGIAEACEPSRTFTPIDTSRGRFKVNVAANLAYFVLQAGVQLWFVRYLIDHLGVATYGLVPLATNTTNYMAIITVALSGSVGRFLTIDLARGDLETANRTFNTSLFASIVLAIALIPAAGCLAWFAPSFLDIPEGEEMGTRFLLMCTGFAFLLNAVGSNFACSTFAKNRFDVQRLIDALGFLTQIGVVVALFTWAGGDLWYVGAGIAAQAVVRQAGYQVSWRKLTPELSMSLRAFDRTRLREILSMGGWMTVDSIGAILYTGVDLLVLNLALGAHAAGLYAPLLQVGSVLRSTAGTVTAVLAPIITAHHARGAQAEIAAISCDSGRILGFVMALPVAVLCVTSEAVLIGWLGPEYGAMCVAFWILTLPLVLTFTVGPWTALYRAANRVRTPALVCVGRALFTVPLSLALIPLLGVNGMALARTLSLIIGAVLFQPLYAAHVLGMPRRRLLAPVIANGLATSAIALVGAAVVRSVPSIPLGPMLASLACSAAWMGLLLSSVGLTRRQRCILGRLLSLHGKAGPPHGGP